MVDALNMWNDYMIIVKSEQWSLMIPLEFAGIHTDNIACIQPRRVDRFFSLQVLNKPLSKENLLQWDLDLVVTNLELDDCIQFVSFSLEIQTKGKINETNMSKAEI